MISKKYLILAIVAIVIISGCAQATLLVEAFNKTKNLVSTTGYSSKYDVSLKIDATQATKDSKLLGDLPTEPMKLREEIAEKGDNTRNTLDVSELAKLSGDSPDEASVFSVYSKKDEVSFCLTSKAGIECTKDKIDSLKKPSLSLSSQLGQLSQISQETPEKTLSNLKKLYDKGALTLGATSKETIIGRQCDKLSYTVSDTSKLDAEDLVAVLGGAGSQQIPPEQLTQSASLLQQLIKSMSTELCLDSQYGIPLKSSVIVVVDMTDFIKGLASSFGGEDRASSVPSELKYTISVNSIATQFNPSTSDSEFDLPAGAKILEPIIAVPEPGLGR